MKDFTMSMYASEKDLYKAKAEYYEELLLDALSLLRDAWASGDRNVFGTDLDNQIEKFIGEVSED